MIFFLKYKTNKNIYFIKKEKKRVKKINIVFSLDLYNSTS